VDDGLPGLRPATPAGHLDRIHDELGAQVVGDRPPDDAPRAHAEHRGTVRVQEVVDVRLQLLWK